MLKKRNRKTKKNNQSQQINLPIREKIDDDENSCWWNKKKKIDKIIEEDDEIKQQKELFGRENGVRYSIDYHGIKLIFVTLNKS